MYELIGMIVFAVFPLCMVLATFYDLFTLTIPNKICVGLIIAFFVLAPIAGVSWVTMAWSTGLALLILTVGFGVFSLGVIGGGDVKLIAASSLWFGTELTADYMLLFAVFGGILCAVLWLVRKMRLPDALSRVRWIARLHDKGTGVPYGLALGPAALIVFPHSQWTQVIA